MRQHDLSQHWYHRVKLDGVLDADAVDSVVIEIYKVGCNVYSDIRVCRLKSGLTMHD